jgi:hypothetical protein
MLYRIQAVIFAALSIVGACQVWGSELQTQKNPLYPYRSTMFLQDDFITGNGSGSWGDLGWISAGTVSLQNGETNRPGIIRLDTGAVAATQSRISYSNSAAIDPANTHTVLWAARVNTNDANTLVRIGSGNSVAGTPPTNGIYFEKLDADTNWFCVTRSGGAQTRTDSTVAVDTNFNAFTYTRNSSGVFFLINNTQVCSQTTNIPTTFIAPYLFIINSAAASKTVDADYFENIIYNLVR